MNYSSNGDPLIKFINVSKNFKNKKVLENINFSINKKSIITLVGPNGAGKSTIAKLILGIEHPSSGKIKKSYGLNFGYVPQEIKLNSSLPLKVKNLLSLLTNNNDENSELLSFAKIEDIGSQDISEISGGQLRKVFLVSCLMNNVDLIVLDEPTKELDIIGQQQFYNLINQVREKFQITIFIISHDLHTVIKTSDQVLCINHHLCCYGKPMEQYDKIMKHIGFYQHHHNHLHQ